MVIGLFIGAHLPEHLFATFLSLSDQVIAVLVEVLDQVSPLRLSDNTNVLNVWPFLEMIAFTRFQISPSCSIHGNI